MDTEGSPARHQTGSEESPERDQTESDGLPEQDQTESKEPSDRDQAESQDSPERDETAAERLDRNWIELLQELRVTQTGVQILLAFLLTLPFQPRFADLDPSMVTVYLVAVSFGTLATFMTVAPVTAHRMLFRKHAKDVLVASGNILAEAGLVCLGLTVVLVVTLVFGFVMGTQAGWLAGATTLVVSLFVWWVLPLVLGRMRRPGPY